MWSQSLLSDIIVDLGAAWIEGTTENPLAIFAEAEEILVHRTSWDKFLRVDSEGHLVQPEYVQFVSFTFFNADQSMVPARIGSYQRTPNLQSSNHNSVHFISFMNIDHCR